MCAADIEQVEESRFAIVLIAICATQALTAPLGILYIVFADIANNFRSEVTEEPEPSASGSLATNAFESTITSKLTTFLSEDVEVTESGRGSSSGKGRSFRSGLKVMEHLRRKVEK